MEKQRTRRALRETSDLTNGLSINNYSNGSTERENGYVKNTNELTQCVFLGALRLKPVSDIFQVTLKPVPLSQLKSTAFCNSFGAETRRSSRKNTRKLTRSSNPNFFVTDYVEGEPETRLYNLFRKQYNKRKASDEPEHDHKLKYKIDVHKIFGDNNLYPKDTTMNNNLNELKMHIPNKYLDIGSTEKEMDLESTIARLQKNRNIELKNCDNTDGNIPIKQEYVDNFNLPYFRGIDPLIIEIDDDEEIEDYLEIDQHVVEDLEALILNQEVGMGEKYSGTTHNSQEIKTEDVITTSSDVNLTKKKFEQNVNKGKTNKPMLLSWDKKAVKDSPACSSKLPEILKRSKNSTKSNGLCEAKEPIPKIIIKNLKKNCPKVENFQKNIKKFETRKLALKKAYQKTDHKKNNKMRKINKKKKQRNYTTLSSLKLKSKGVLEDEFVENKVPSKVEVEEKVILKVEEVASEEDIVTIVKEKLELTDKVTSSAGSVETENLVVEEKPTIRLVENNEADKELTESTKVLNDVTEQPGGAVPSAPTEMKKSEPERTPKMNDTNIKSVNAENVNEKNRSEPVLESNVESQINDYLGVKKEMELYLAQQSNKVIATETKNDEVIATEIERNDSSKNDVEKIVTKVDTPAVPDNLITGNLDTTECEVVVVPNPEIIEDLTETVESNQVLATASSEIKKNSLLIQETDNKIGENQNDTPMTPMSKNNEDVDNALATSQQIDTQINQETVIEPKDENDDTPLQHLKKNPTNEQKVKEEIDATTEVNTDKDEKKKPPNIPQKSATSKRNGKEKKVRPKTLLKQPKKEIQIKNMDKPDRIKRTSMKANFISPRRVSLRSNKKIETKQIVKSKKKQHKKNNQETEKPIDDTPEVKTENPRKIKKQISSKTKHVDENTENLKRTREKRKSKVSTQPEEEESVPKPKRRKKLPPPPEDDENAETDAPVEDNKPELTDEMRKDLADPNSQLSREIEKQMQMEFSRDFTDYEQQHPCRYQRIYRCRVCLKVFETYNRLRTHKQEHAVKNPYRCQECGQAYEDVEELAAHIRIHRGKMPYPCKKCDESFWTSVQLDRHQLVHVLKKVPPPTNCAPKKIFKCEECGKQFKKICDLERHTRVHTGEKPSVCNICNKRFQQAYNLNKHLLIHTQEKKFECVICQKKFGRNDVLNRHVLTHSIEKPFHCSLCSKTFIRNMQLNIHLQKHHNVTPEATTSNAKSGEEGESSNL